MTPFSSTFDCATGNLMIHEIDCLIHWRLNKIDFFSLAKRYLLYQNKDFFDCHGFFHFEVPIKLWDNKFRLTVLFSPKPPETPILCTGYALSIFDYGGAEQDESISALLANILSTALGASFANEPYTDAKTWHRDWGVVSLRAIIQNGTEPQIGIGWKSDVSTET